MNTTVTKINHVAEIFNNRFNVQNHHSVRDIEFNPAWSNGTGYYNGAVSGEHAPILSSGEMVRCITTNNRKMIIVGTPLGNIAVFQRYTACDDVFVLNASSELDKTHMYEKSGGLTERDITMILGKVYLFMEDGEYKQYITENNIGETIEQIIKVANELAKAKATNPLGVTF